ncbi:class III lanthionine synthetase LanKC N-terminal domain-containing protein [Nonomuraea sediminis]|uniref:class III lanthionine synthetase LanKC N-terminal domain-containing protein n=1 Tax=Nonomuraea sediminis TaxID=2835864 RepID=UPI001BDC8103|nr:hypothetical protein [Nonomuraea sediminis]
MTGTTAGEYADRLRGLLPPSWTLSRDAIWLHAQRPPIVGGAGTAPIAQGFKIHVSVEETGVSQALELIVPCCVGHGVEFKIAADSSVHQQLNGKWYPRGSSGKFMTIYPPDEAAFMDLIELVHQRTRQTPLTGPRILSDRRYRDSRILFYRYGGFHPARRVNLDGTHSTFLVSPEGEHVLDERLPYFELPAWVRDPFEEVTGVATGDRLLRDRYRIEGAIRFSNSGGVYYGTDTRTAMPVVVKEARPSTNVMRVGEYATDAVTLLTREFTVQRALHDLAFVPRAIELFTAGEHTFMVQQRVEGEGLRPYWARNELILVPYIRRPGRIARWAPRFKAVAETLLRMVEAVHERGFLLGDLSSGNLMIDASSGRMWLLDVESAVAVGCSSAEMRHAALWGTPGFLHPERRSRGELLPADDFYAAGMVLCDALVPVSFISLNPAALSPILEELVSLGLPPQVRDTIFALRQGAVAEASAILDAWRV